MATNPAYVGNIYPDTRGVFSQPMQSYHMAGQGVHATNYGVGDQGGMNQQVVIMNQPGRVEQPSFDGVRDWSTGLCGCFEDCCSCAYAWFCYPCFTCTLAESMNECMCGPFCCGRAFVIPMRTKIRTMYKIKGSICKDICITMCCEFCAATQMYREIRNQKGSY